ncbi:hypothetical protein DID88_001803 [Monilinia fructigena]|uniref:CBS domain-containing protein n=1 Tax=Monilinia fructigena TaxID=38457 RepID=A0A395IWX6_9HELO|nr:hypothetical protein DID88_001803 [Monilinia fructigena]
MAASTTGTMRARGQLPAFSNSSASNIPRPAQESHATHSKKQSKRDEAIRRKIETDLSKKSKTTGRARQTRKAPPGTVLALRPSQALQIKPNTTVAEAAQLMAAKREDCVLVTDDDDRIAGIFTAKDLAFRVVGAGIKAANITIAEIMTKNPLCARTGYQCYRCLGFNDISGILDITKCFYDAMEKLERAYSSSRKLYDALEGVQSELGSSQPQQIIQYVEALRSKMSGPTLESVLTGIPPTTVTVRTSVKEAAALMKENHTTAVLVQDGGSITGIFTSKDVVLRVIAPGLDPSNCSVVRVMTPHPDFAPMDMSIQAALRKMHDGHYLNLPVMNAQGEIVGMVDVLKLTYATLEQINTMQLVKVTAAQHGTNSPSHSHLSRHVDIPPEDVPFAFKFKAPSGRVHRVQVIASHGLSELITAVTNKLGAEIDAVGGVATVEDGKLGTSGFALSYLDDEGDSVSITTDEDLLEAIVLAKNGHRDKVDLFVHDPEKPPMAATLDPQPPVIQVATPPGSGTIRRRRTADEDDESDDEPRVRSKSRKSAAPQPAPEVIQGVPNELLLPGAIVTLAVVIVGVFALTRATSR